MRTLALCAAVAFHGTAPAQPSAGLRHRVFAYWGYNRAQYSASDIRLTGTDYDITVHDVAANDRPTPFSFADYLAPANIWIPQYNYRVGWFLNDHWSFSLGMDHMKYVAVTDQTVDLSGTISPERSATWAMSDAARRVRLTEDLLAYEHTDGLNLLSVDADRYDRLLASPNGKHALHLTEGLSIGPVIPRTDVRLFGERTNNRFHVAGYGIGAQAGLFAVLWDHVFIRAGVRAGHIRMPDVLTTGSDEDRARQHFWFMEEYAVLGALIGKRAP